MGFWRNPEFVRHRRAQLRPARALTAACLALVACLLVGLLCWTGSRQDFFRIFYFWLLGIQGTALVLWCPSNCGQGISREREMKTFDFFRTTRLTSWELVEGMTLGLPILAYYTVGCSLLIAVPVGLLAGISPIVMIETYALILAFTLVLSLFALWMSLRYEKSQSGLGGFVGLLVVGFGTALAGSVFPGLGAAGLLPAIMELYDQRVGDAVVHPMLFGFPISYTLSAYILFTAFGAWHVLKLTRNLKRDIEEISALSRWQAIGYAVFLNVLFFAFLDAARAESYVAGLVVGLNAAIFYTIGLGTLTPQERLKMWWRRREAGQASYFSEDGLPWPWVALTAVLAYILMAIASFAFQNTIGFEAWRFGSTAVQLLAFVIFAIRDILFLQWCKLTGMKQPEVKGLLFLGLYYVAVMIIASVVSSDVSWPRSVAVTLLTPFAVFSLDEASAAASPWLYGGLGLQIVLTLVIMQAIITRLRRPAVILPIAKGVSG